MMLVDLYRRLGKYHSLLPDELAAVELVQLVYLVPGFVSAGAVDQLGEDEQEVDGGHALLGEGRQLHVARALGFGHSGQKNPRQSKSCT